MAENDQFSMAFYKDVSEVSLNSVLNTLRGIRMTFIVNGRNVVKRLDAKGE